MEKYLFVDRWIFGRTEQQVHSTHAHLTSRWHNKKNERQFDDELLFNDRWASFIRNLHSHCLRSDGFKILHAIKRETKKKSIFFCFLCLMNVKWMEYCEISYFGSGWFGENCLKAKEAKKSKINVTLSALMSIIIIFDRFFSSILRRLLVSFYSTDFNWIHTCFLLDSPRFTCSFNQLHDWLCCFLVFIRSERIVYISIKFTFSFHCYIARRAV